MAKRWNRAKVIAAIQARHAKGLSLRGVETKDRELYSAASRHFGNWGNAMLAAAFPANRHQRWTAESVIAIIRERMEQGGDVNGLARENRCLVQAARRHCGSWHKALLLAGISEVRHRRWDRERILREIAALGEQGIELIRKNVPPTLYEAARQHFQSWADAIEAVGYEPPAWPSPRWTRDRVIDEIRALRRGGLPLTTAANNRLASAAVRLFGTWTAAIQAAGGQTRPPQVRLTRESVLTQLQELKNEHRFDESTWTENRRLVRAAKRHFGSWCTALVAAGILRPQERRRCRKRWKPHRVIAAIQDRYIRGLPLAASQDRNLASAAERCFGSWHAAVLAAGLDPGEKPKPRRRWTRELVVAELAARHAQGLPMRNLSLTASSLACAARRYFKTWHDALRAADIVDVKGNTKCRGRA